VESEALERVSRAEAESVVALASACEDVEGFVRKITVLVDELAAEGLALEVSEREHQARFEECTLLQTRGSKLCHAIIGPPRSRHHLSDGMKLAALRHTKMARELTVFRVAVSATAKLVLEPSPSGTSRTEVVGELAAKFLKVEDQRSWLGWPTARICNLLLGSPPGQPNWLIVWTRPLDSLEWS
jgi:hypothetical protein